MTARRDSPYEFRKKDGVWQRRRIGERKWLTLEVEQKPPANTQARRDRSAEPSPRNEWRWT